jgi:cyanate lyase
MQSVPKGVPANPALPIYNLPTNVSLFEAKARKGLTFDQIARVIDKDEVWLAAAFYGQARTSSNAHTIHTE